MNILLAIGLAFFTFAAQADWTDTAIDEFQVAPPPAVGSPEYQRDYQILHDYESTRTSAQCREASAETFAQFEVFFGSILSSREIATVERLAKKVENLASDAAGHYKGIFKRDRPYNIDRTLRPCIPKPFGSKAYPSSHATQAATLACVLADIYPDRADALLERGRQAGENRVLGGVHHPSDVEAGQKLANDLCASLMTQADFLQDLDDVRP